MTDTKDKQHELAKQKKVVPNSLRLKTTSSNSFNGSLNQKNMASILNRLPFLHQLKEAENSLLKLSPVWLKWCAAQANSSTANLTTNSQLKALKDGELSIYCETPIIASLIKHQQNNLLNTFHDAGFNHIRRIKIQVRLHQTNVNPELSAANHLDEMQTMLDKKKRAKPNSDAFKSIETVQLHIKNEKLAASLSRLGETLKKSS